MSLFDSLRDDARGVQILKDWLGDGGIPVLQEQADSRALACVQGNEGNPCPHNREPNWWDRNAKHPVAVEIIKQLEVKTRLKISTPHDAGLAICDVCRCVLLLKVHTPIKHIAEHTAVATVSKFPAYCRFRQELEAL